MTSCHKNIAQLAAVLLLVSQTVFAQSEAIKVHGDWTIVVKDPDGAVVSQHAFKNALVPPGSNALAYALSGRARTGTWSIWLQGLSGPCRNLFSNSSACEIWEPADNGMPTSTHPQVTVSLTREMVGSTVKLQGVLRMPAATGPPLGSITQVSTLLTLCGPAQDATPCTRHTQGASHNFFSQKAFDVPIQITFQQLIEVTVVLSFQ
jgi:hypothetical protein